MNNTTKMNIFNLFHDGDFVSLSRNDHEVLFEVEIPYIAELIQPEYTSFRGILKGCHVCQFELWDDRGVVYEDIKTINMLIKGMEILSAKLDGEQVVVNCQGMQKAHRGGNFIFSCDDILLFDEGGLSVATYDLQELSRKAIAVAFEEQKKQM